MYTGQDFEEDDDSVQRATYATLSTTPVINTIYRGNVIVSRDQYSCGGAQYEVSSNALPSSSATGIHNATSNGEEYMESTQEVSNDNVVAAGTIRSTSPLQTDPPEDENFHKKTATIDCAANESVPKKPPKFICNHCNKGFRHKSYYDYHLRTHTGDRPFQCTICNKGFFERSKLNRHLSSCHNINTSIYEDDIQEVKSHNCPHCQKSFSRNSGLKAHLLAHEGSRPFPCTQCDRWFSGLTALKNHEATHQGVKGILCDICGKAFLLKKYLDLHLKTTHKKEQRKHRCPRCRKEFHSAKDLKRHQLMHSNERRYSCRLCNTSFKRKDNLNRHLKLTHLITTEQIHQDSSTAVLEITSSHQPTVTHDVSNQPTHTAPLPPPLNHQVSVIKSTHEVMMSIARGIRYN